MMGGFGLIMRGVDKLGRGLTLQAARRGLGIGLVMGLTQDATRGIKGYGSGVFEWFGWDGKEVIFNEPEYWLVDYIEECEEDQRRWADPDFRRAVRERVKTIDAALAAQKEQSERRSIKGLVGFAKAKWAEYKADGKPAAVEESKA